MRVRVLKDFQARRDRSRRKAIEKYGATGQQAGGDPNRDVFDHAVNELVGLLRYAEMMEARLRGFDLPEGLRESAFSVCRQLSAAASRHALDLIDVRHRLQARAIALGTAEAA